MQKDTYSLPSERRIQNQDTLWIERGEEDERWSLQVWLVYKLQKQPNITRFIKYTVHLKKLSTDKGNINLWSPTPHTHTTANIWLLYEHISIIHCIQKVRHFFLEHRHTFYSCLFSHQTWLPLSTVRNVVHVWPNPASSVNIE